MRSFSKLNPKWDTKRCLILPRSHSTTQFTCTYTNRPASHGLTCPFSFPPPALTLSSEEWGGGLCLSLAPCVLVSLTLSYSKHGGGGRVGALSDRRGERIKVSAWIRFFSSPPTINICSCFSHKSLVGIKMPNYHSWENLNMSNQKVHIPTGLVL